MAHKLSWSTLDIFHSLGEIPIKSDARWEIAGRGKSRKTVKCFKKENMQLKTQDSNAAKQSSTQTHK